MHPWATITDQLSPFLSVFNELIGKDSHFLAFVKPPAIPHRLTFQLGTAVSSHGVAFTIEDGICRASANVPHAPVFTLLASPEHWEQFFQSTPVAPFQSYWGMFGMNIKQEGIQIQGDQQSFNQHAHIWRRILEVLHEAYCGPMKIDEQPEEDEDSITGRYVYIITPLWGRCKIYYEESGSGDQEVVFLHTAGADSRQYHGVMNNITMREMCRMIAFDLPAHGRSFPPENHM